MAEQYYVSKKYHEISILAKGIALFDRESERPRLKYVFDMSDVHKARRIGKDPYLWEIREEHKDIVLTQLEKAYAGSFEKILKKCLQIRQSHAIMCG